MMVRHSWYNGIVDLSPHIPNHYRDTLIRVMER